MGITAISPVGSTEKEETVESALEALVLKEMCQLCASVMHENAYCAHALVTDAIDTR